MIKFSPAQNNFKGFFEEIKVKKKSGFFPVHIIPVNIILHKSYEKCQSGLDQFSDTYDNMFLL